MTRSTSLTAALCRGSLAAMLLLLAACQQPRAPVEIAEAKTVASIDDSLEVTDGLGRKISLPSAPERIVSLAPKNTEMLFALGAGKQVVGVTNYCDYPEAAKQVDKVGGFSARSLSYERIVSLKPDLVLTAGDLHVPVIEELERLSIPAMALSADSFEGMCDELRLLGRVTKRQDEAKRLISNLQSRLDGIRQTAATIPKEERVTVCYLVAEEPLTAAGPASYLGEMIGACGAINVIDDRSVKFPKVSDEVLLSRDPDVIMAPSHHAAFLSRESLDARPGWAGLKAVQSGRTHVLDGNLVSRCGPRLVDALERIAATLYPKYFSEAPTEEHASGAAP